MSVKTGDTLNQANAIGYDRYRTFSIFYQQYQFNVVCIYFCMIYFIPLAKGIFQHFVMEKHHIYYYMLNLKYWFCYRKRVNIRYVF